MTKFQHYALLASLLVAFLKTLLLSPTPADVAVIAVMGTIFAYLEYKKRDKELEKFEAELKKHQEEINDLKDKMSRVNIAQQFKAGALGSR